MRPAQFRRFVAYVVVLVSALLLTTGTAQALVKEVPQVVEDNLLSFAEYAQLEGLDPNAACDQACSDLVADLQRPATAVADPVPETVTKSLFDNRFANVAKAFVPRTPIGLTAAGALLYANYRVWRFQVFGAHPKDYFVKISAAATDVSQLSWQFVDGSSAAWYPTFFDLPDPLPVGAIATTYGRAAIIWHEGAPGPGSSRCGEQALSPTPSDVEVYSWHWNTCFEGYVNGQEVDTPMMGFGWKVRPQFFDPPTNLPSTPPTAGGFDANPLSQQDMENRVDTILHSDDPDYDVLKDWACAVFGGDCKNPRDAYHTTPDCAGMTVSACTQAFRDAGFTGPVTTETLDPDDAIMEQGPGKVTASYPHEGIEIAEPRSITLYANPDPMPTMTAVDTAVADTLETQNPDTIDDTNKKTIARECRTLAAEAGRATNDCTSLPLFVVGRDAVQPARNDRAAIEDHPEWFALNRRADSPNTRWYRNQPGCLTGQRPAANWQCDEYPYWASMQAQNGPLNTATPRIVWTPDAENGLEGRALKKFYGEDGPGVFPWSGCNIEARQLTDVTPTLASTYLVIPIPDSQIKTMGVCNSPVP